MGKSNRRLLLVAVSEGGPPLVHAILSQLRDEFPVPIIVCPIFRLDSIKPLCNAWNKTTRLSVKTVKETTDLLPGSVYVVPYGFTGRIEDSPCTISLVLNPAEKEKGQDAFVQILISAGKVFGEQLNVVLAGDMVNGVESMSAGLETVYELRGRLYSVSEHGERISPGLELIVKNGIGIQFISADELVMKLYAWCGWADPVRSRYDKV